METLIKKQEFHSPRPRLIQRAKALNKREDGEQEKKMIETETKKKLIKTKMLIKQEHLD